MRMDDLPTMETMARRQKHYGVKMSTDCIMCNGGTNTDDHMWLCPATRSNANREIEKLHDWLKEAFYKGSERERER